MFFEVLNQTSRMCQCRRVRRHSSFLDCAIRSDTVSFTGAVLWCIAKQWWLDVDYRKIVHDRSVEVTAKILSGLVEKTGESDTFLLVIILADRRCNCASLQPVPERAKEDRIEVVDLYTRLVEQVNQNPDLEEQFFTGGHMSPEGSA